MNKLEFGHVFQCNCCKARVWGYDENASVEVKCDNYETVHFGYNKEMDDYFIEDCYNDNVYSYTEDDFLASFDVSPIGYDHIITQEGLTYDELVKSIESVRYVWQTGRKVFEFVVDKPTRQIF